MIELFENPNFYYLLIASIYIALFSVVLVKRLQRRGKYKIRMITASGEEKITWRGAESDGETIVMEKAKGKKLGWTFKFDNSCVLRATRSWYSFGGDTKILEVYPNADKAISHNAKDKITTPAHWDKRAEEKLFEAGVIKAAGASIQKVQISPILYILIGLSVVFSFLTFLASSGRIRI